MSNAPIYLTCATEKSFSNRSGTQGDAPLPLDLLCLRNLQKKQEPLSKLAFDLKCPSLVMLVYSSTDKTQRRRGGIPKTSRTEP